MTKNLADYRRVYLKGELQEKELPNDPLIMFQEWFNQIETLKDRVEVNAMTVSTIGVDGFPRSRVVLLKEFNKEGFIFYTNYNSEKGKSLDNNPKICLSFFWPDFERQVIIQGKAEKSSEEKAKEYFALRPRGSQLGAWASNQSSEIESRQVLEQRLKELQEKFEEQQVPKPEFWGGYLVRPEKYEFWQGRANRLHDRILYKKESNKWHLKRLAP